MLNRFIFFFLFIINLTFAVNRPEINPTLNAIIERSLKDALQSGDKDEKFFDYYRYALDIGIDSFSYFSDFKASFIQCLQKALEEGRYFSFKQNCYLYSKYYLNEIDGLEGYNSTIELSELGNLKEILQKGVGNALKKGHFYACDSILQMANENQLTLDFSEEELLEFFKEGISASLVRKLKLDESVPQLAISLGIKPSKEDLKISIEKGIKDSLQLHTAKNLFLKDLIKKNGWKPYYKKLLPLKIKHLQKIEAFCLTNQIDVDLFSVSEMQQWLSSYVFEITSSEKSYLEDHSIKTDEFKIRSENKEYKYRVKINKINPSEEEVTTEIVCNNALFYENSRYLELGADSIESIFEMLFRSDPFSDLSFLVYDTNIESIKEQIFKQDELFSEEKYSKIAHEAFIKALTEVSLYNLNNCTYLLELARKLDIAIDPLDLKKNFQNKILKGLNTHYSEEYKYFFNLIEFAKSLDVQIDLHEILMEKLKEQIAEGDPFEIITIIDLAKENGIEISLKQLSDIDDLIIQGIIKSYGRSSFHPFVKLMKKNNFSVDVLKGLQDLIKILISEAYIEEINSFIELENDDNIDDDDDDDDKDLEVIIDGKVSYNFLDENIELSKIPEIEKAFYQGCQKAIDNEAYFVYLYLVQLAVDNKVILDPAILRKFEEKLSLLDSWTKEEFRTMLIPNYLYDYYLDYKALNKKLESLNLLYELE